MRVPLYCKYPSAHCVKTIGHFAVISHRHGSRPPCSTHSKKSLPTISEGKGSTNSRSHSIARISPSPTPVVLSLVLVIMLTPRISWDQARSTSTTSSELTADQLYLDDR